MKSMAMAVHVHEKRIALRLVRKGARNFSGVGRMLCKGELSLSRATAEMAKMTSSRKGSVMLMLL